MTFEQSLTARQPIKLTVDDYLLLDRAGVFDRYSKAELIDGSILVVNAQFSEHMVVKNGVYRRLADACERQGLHAWSEGSVDMSPDSMPEPDLLVTSTRPTPGAVRLDTLVLVGEVADSTLASDLGIKADLYAAKGIAEYWVIDVKARAIHQLWAPGADGYGERRTVPFGERIEAVTLPGLGIETDALL